LRPTADLEGQVPVFISLRNWEGPIVPPDTAFPSRRLQRLTGLRCRYSNLSRNWELVTVSGKKLNSTFNVQSPSTFEFLRWLVQAFRKSYISRSLSGRVYTVERVPSPHDPSDGTRNAQQYTPPIVDSSVLWILAFHHRLLEMLCGRKKCACVYPLKKAILPVNCFIVFAMIHSFVPGHKHQTAMTVTWR
jgi:hypothetical protein